MFLLVSICSLLVGLIASAGQGFPSDVCPQLPLGRIRSILDLTKVTNGLDAARRSITIALNQLGQHEVAKEISLQLKEEITKSLLKNSTSPIPENKLALYIHALLATGTNPRSFHGVNLVADLRHRVDSARTVHPFLVLALCNSNASHPYHLEQIKMFLERSTIDMKAQALKAFTCVGTWAEPRLNQYQVLMQEASNSLATALEQISLDVFTTSLVVEALTAYQKVDWNKEKALDFLAAESESEMNIAKAYYIEKALNSGRVRFIKDLYGGPFRTAFHLENTKNITVKLTIKDGKMDISVILQVTEGSTFLQTVEKASQISQSFRFSYVIDSNENPYIYSIDGIANDPEMGTFWHICRRTPKRQEGTTKSPPSDGEHIMFIYSSSDSPCPAKDSETD